MTDLLNTTPSEESLYAAIALGAVLLWTVVLVWLEVRK